MKAQNLGLTSLTKIKQRWLSTPVAGALVTNKSNMRQAGPTAVAAVKVWPGSDVAAEAPLIFLLRRFSLRSSLREASKEETAW